MTARASVQTLLEEDSELLSIGVLAVYASNAVDTPEESLFIVVRWEPSIRAFKQIGPDRITVWAHDKERDYGRIDRILARVRQLLPASVHVAGADGWTLTTAEWLGEGPDLFDGGYQTVTRYADFQVVSRYTASG